MYWGVEGERLISDNGAINSKFEIRLCIIGADDEAASKLGGESWEGLRLIMSETKGDLGILSKDRLSGSYGPYMDIGAFEDW